MDSLLLHKAGSVIVMIILTVIFGLIPIKIRTTIVNTLAISEKRTSIFLSSSLCFGAGVLMATVFLHILKEAREKFQILLDESILSDSEYPIPELAMCLGFFLIYLLEEVIVSCIQYTHSPGVNDLEADTFVRTASINLNSKAKSGLREEQPLHFKQNMSIPNQIKESGCNCSNRVGTEPICERLSENLQCEDKTPEKIHSSSAKHPRQFSIINSIVIVMSLSLHGIFEGLSLGLEDSQRNVWLLCAALSSHKVFIAFSIGMELLEINVKRFVYAAHILVFSLASPVGVLIGTLLQKSARVEDAALKIVIAILQGLSAGTILYVTFCEVLERERIKPSGRYTRLCFLVAGFAVMAALESVGGHRHDHNSSFSDNVTALNLNHGHNHQNHDH